MADNDLEELLHKAVDNCGVDRIALELRKLTAKDSDSRNVLTVIGNAGVHKIPTEYLLGEIYEVSRGSWDTSSSEILQRTFIDLLRGLARKLQSKRWSNIYFIPTGHPAFSIQIKTLIYRLLRQNTVDLYHVDGRYLELVIDHRQIALDISADRQTGKGDGGNK